MGVAVLGAVAVLFLLLGSDPEPEVPALAWEEPAKQAPPPVAVRVRGTVDAEPRPARVRDPGPCPTEFGDVLKRAKDWAWVHGTRTRFTRRLELGRQFLRLKRELEAETIDLCTARCTLRVMELRMLMIEKRASWRSDDPDPIARQDIDALFEQGDEVGRDAWLRMLTRLTEPRRDRDAFDLHVVGAPADEYGSTSHVRVWTPKGGAFPAAAIRESEAILGRLDRIVGGRREEGYDVLSAPGLGTGIFPMFRPPGSAIGLYFLFDEFAIVEASYRGAELQRLLNHELLHGWWDEVMEDWDARFVAEGFAAYLEWLRGTDGGLDVPDRRLEHNMAAVLRVLERLAGRGWAIESFPLRKLIRASPWGFYAMGWLAYGIAQACFAYVPERVLREALRTRSEEVLLQAFETIEWSALLAWMREIAGGGAPTAARFPEDRMGSGGDLVDRDASWIRRRMIHELFGKGVSGDDVEDTVFGNPSDPELDTPARREAVLARLADAAGQPLDFVLEPYGLERARVRAEARAAPWEGDHVAADTTDALPFVERARAWFAADPPARALTLAAAEQQTRRVVRFATGERPMAMDGLLQYLRTSAAAKGGDLVLLVSSADEAFRARVAKGAELPPDLEAAERETRLARHAIRGLHHVLAASKWRARTVLVLDLGDGGGEARALADAMQRAAPRDGLVAYWHVGGG